MSEPNKQGGETKTVEFSYPTSDNAKRFGFYVTGCYTVEKIIGNKPPIALAGFAMRDEAITHAKTLTLEWNRYFLRFNANPDLEPIAQGNGREWN